jgi:hypothetical protein
MRTEQQARVESNGGHRSRRQPLPAGAAVEVLENRRLLSADVVFHWNDLLMQSLPSTSAPVPFFRNVALVQVAVFDAVNAIDRSYEPYAADVKASRGASKEAAAAQAAHDTLSALYPSRRAIFDAALAEDLAGIAPGRARQGIAVGQEVARQILQLRANDGANTPASFTPPNANPGQWQPTPPDFSPAGLVNAPLMTPFAIESPSQFRPVPPPALGSAAYAAALNEAKLVGAADAATADRDQNGLPDRTPEQTQTAMLWRVPFTMFGVWNGIAQDVARDHDANIVDTARLFALMDVAIHDGLQTSLASKYHYALWRPVTAIRRAGEDGNPATTAETTWTPLHPSTPPYGTYAGNAATIGASAATALADVFGTDAVPFDVDWSPYGFAGVTRSYDGFWDAADEQARSRVLGGIHFTFDSVAGQGIGRNVGNYVTDNLLTPRGNNSSFESDPPPATAATARAGVSSAGRTDSGIQTLLLSDANKSPLI